jgi:hypothetical protein
LNALAQAARAGGAVSNPPGLTGAEADKLRSQFYSNMPVQRIADDTGSPQAMLSYDVNKRIDPALLDSLSGSFAPQAAPLPLVPGGTGIGFGQTPAAGLPGTAVAPFTAQGIRPGTPAGMPAAPFMAQGVRPGTPAGMPAAPFTAQGVRPGTPAGMPAAPFMAQGVRPGTPAGMPGAPIPPAPAGGIYDTDMLNSKGIARYLMKDIMPQTATSQTQQGGGFDLMNLLVGQAQGAEYPTATPADPYPFYAPAYQGVGGQVEYNPTDPNRVAGEVTPVPTRTYRAGQVSPLDVLLAQIGSISPFAEVKRDNALVMSDPFYQAQRTYDNPTGNMIGGINTPEASAATRLTSPQMAGGGPRIVQTQPIDPYLPGYDLNDPNRPSLFPASPMEDALIAQGIKSGIPMAMQDPSGTGRLVTDPVTGITQEAGSTQTAGYDPLMSYDMVKLFQQGPSATPVASVVPRERPSLYDFAVSNPGWAIEKMRAIEDAGTMADNSDYGNLVSGLENSPNRTADMMSQGAKLRAAEDYANANDIPVSDTYGGAEDKTDQLLQIYEDKVAPTLPKTGGTTAGAVFTPGPGQFVGTNGYVYEQSGDGSFKQVGKVPGYTDAQLYEAANKGAFRNPNAIPVGSAPKKKAAAKKKPSDNTVKASEDGGLFSWFTDIQNGLDDFRAENRRKIGLSPRNKKADGGMVNKYGSGGIASWITEGSKEAKAIMDPPTHMEQLAAAGWSPSMMEGSPSTSSRNTSAKNSDGKAGSGSSSTTTTTSGAPAGYTPPTQAQIDALYAPYFQQSVMPPATYVPGLSGEFNYFPTMPKPVTPPSNPTIQSGTAASDWFNKYMNAKNQGDKKSARKDIATGTTTFHSLFDKYRSTLGNKAQPSLQSWLDWYGKQSFAEGGAVLEPRLVLGHGGPTSDNIPANIDGVQEARLSNGEFVMTAAAVKNAGDGDMQKGAERLMHLNEMLSYGRPAGKLNVEKVAGKAK